MSRYYSLIIFLLFFTSCASKSASDIRMPLVVGDNKINTHFQKNDLYVMYALDAKYRGDFEQASAYFEKLYDDTHDALYIQEAIKSRILLKEYKEIHRLLDKGLKRHPTDVTLQRFLAAYYLDTHQFKKANALLKKLVAKWHDESDRALLASTQLGMGETKKALKYYKNAYKKDKNPKILLPYVNILYYDLGQKKKAIRLLNTHVDFIGCDEKLCYKLLEFYQKEQDIEGLVSTAKKLFKKTGDIKFAKMVVDIYAYQQDTKSAMLFLEKSHVNDPALLQIYLTQKAYKKAAALSKKLYEESQDLHYLAQIAMIQYESSQNKKSKKLLQSVQEKFQKVLKEIDSPTYENYYGYILIDQELDVKRGIALIKKALQKVPNSTFFIDSLAWGYYKDNACQKALDTIEPIMIETTEPEILEHYKQIKACNKGKKK